MHGMVIDGEYPTGAVGGADFFTRAARGMIVEQGPDGPVERAEKVIITERYVDMDDPIVGQICVGERSIRHLAHEFGMVDGWRVERVIDDNHSLRDELVKLSQRVAEQDAQLRFAEEQRAKREVHKVWLALDGTEHVSRRGCVEASAAAIGSDTTAIRQAVRQPLVPALGEVTQ